ncbi:hypothetical protein T01_13755 [Trichinella spiralis]|uniref:Uncharacterized protein n=1 Tax=Trichinella spiralis TaxID=6334 RepID=A0A0V0Z039_TRISP|nr:hypothetical protein T01_2646 [Trichinella spiralis]KRY12916.1 hypothetical protein T01_13755 [Trichinella spiralis]
MKKNRLAQNKEILHKTSQFQRISDDNAKHVSYIKTQPSWSRFKGAIYSTSSGYFAMELSRTF